MIENEEMIDLLNPDLDVTALFDRTSSVNSTIVQGRTLLPGVHTVKCNEVKVKSFDWGDVTEVRWTDINGGYVIDKFYTRSADSSKQWMVENSMNKLRNLLKCVTPELKKFTSFDDLMDCEVQIKTKKGKSWQDDSGSWQQGGAVTDGWLPYSKVA